MFWKNGAGKSSLFDAIGYAFFWSGSKDFVRGNVGDLRSYFVWEDAPCKVELQFEYGMERYRIVRVIARDRKGQFKDFIAEERDTCISSKWERVVGTREVTEYIRCILGISRDIFLKSVFAKQKEIEVLSWNKEERKRLIHEITGISGLEKAIESIKEDIRTLEDTKKYLVQEIVLFWEENVKQEKDRIESVWMEQKRMYESFEKEYQCMQAQYQSMKEEEKKLQEKKEAYTYLQNRLAFQQKEKERIQQQKEMLAKKLQEFETIQKEVQSKQWIEEKERAIYQEVETLRKEYLRFKEYEHLKAQYEAKKRYYLEVCHEEERMANLCAQSDTWELEKELETLYNREKELLVKKESFLLELKNCREKGETLKKEYEDIKALGKKGICPTCHRPLGEYAEKIVWYYNQELEKKRKEYLSLKAWIRELEKEHEALAWMIASMQKRVNTMMEYREKQKQYVLLKESVAKEIQQLEEAIALYSQSNFSLDLYQQKEQEYEAIQKEYNEYKRMLGYLQSYEHYQRDYEALLGEEKRMHESFLMLLQEKQALSYQEEEYKIFLQKKEELESTLHALQRKKEQLLQELSQTTFLLEEKKGMLDRISKKKQEVSDTETQLQECKLMIHILQEYREYLLSHLKPSIECIASEYFCGITQGRYHALTLDENYMLYIEEKPIELYSWGERDLAYLCFRIALWKHLLGGVNASSYFLILDEVLWSQDKERQLQILFHLKKLEHHFSQIFLISHNEDIKEMVPSLIEVIMLSAEESTIRVYEN